MHERRHVNGFPAIETGRQFSVAQFGFPANGRVWGQYDRKFPRQRQGIFFQATPTLTDKFALNGATEQEIISGAQVA